MPRVCDLPEIWLLNEAPEADQGRDSVSAVFPWISLPPFVVGGRLMRCALVSGVVRAELRDPRLQLDTLVEYRTDVCSHLPDGCASAPSPAGPH